MAERIPRLKSCLANWPEAREGEYNPSCCRFPKTCSADVYDPQYVPDSELEFPYPNRQGETMADHTPIRDVPKGNLPGIPVDLREDGLLWLFNTSVLHPRGYALSVGEDGALRLLGDGREPWDYLTKEQHPDNLNAIDTHALFDAVRDMFERATRENS